MATQIERDEDLTPEAAKTPDDRASISYEGMTREGIIALTNDYRRQWVNTNKNCNRLRKCLTQAETDVARYRGLYREAVAHANESLEALERRSKGVTLSRPLWHAFLLAFALAVAWAINNAVLLVGGR